MFFIRNLKIKNKLLILLVILLPPLLFFLVSMVNSDIREKQKLQMVFDKLKESEALSNLLHEFQKERALSLSYLASRETSFQNQLEIQRQNTDVVINELTEIQQTNQSLATDLATLTQLQSFRRQVDEFTVDSLAYANFTVGIRERLLNRIQANANNIDDPDIRRQLNTYASLVEAKVHLSMLRTLISQMIISQDISIKDYGNFKSLKSFYDISIKKFSQTASPAIVTAYQNQLKDSSFQDVIALMATLERDATIDFVGQDANIWFTKFTNAIDQLNVVETTTIETAMDLMSRTIAYMNRLLIFYIAFVVIVMALAIMFSYYTVDSIANSIQLLKAASDRVLRGYTDVTINIRSKDEIGDLANSFRKLVQKNIQLSQVAEAVGEGRYDIAVEAQNEGDVLANALKQMKDKLHTFSIENENRQWHLSGISTLNDTMDGATHINDIGTKIIHFLVKYLKADVGALYLLDDFEQLHYVAGYALDIKAGSTPAYRMGEGVVGQAVLNNEIIVLNDMPAKHLTIKTAITETTPLAVAVIPLYFEKNNIGVIEIASRKNFSAQERNFLKAVSEKISVVIHSLKAHIRTQELLYETQNQAEELETQQEELRQINAELKEQKEQLQASEEELRASQQELEEKNSELEEQFEAIRNKNREIEEAREAIELKMQQVETISKYKSEFLANMSHELRTPLNSILILSKLMADNTQKNLTPKQQEHAEIIHNSGADLLKLINDILDLSKIESGQVNLEIREFNPRQIRMRGYYDHTAQQKNIEFVSDFAEDLPDSIATDQFRLEQVIKNLLSNAFKFTPPEGKISYKVFPVHHKVAFTHPSLKASKQVVAFAVQDTGIGISADKQQLIFEAFQQADASTTRRYGGTGLGLAISRELANLLGGEIHLESEESKGSTFTLYLPVNYSQNTHTIVPPQKPEKAGTIPTNGKAPLPVTSSKKTTTLEEIIDQNYSDKREKTVLIIEDDKGFSQIVADFATHKQFKVFQAFNGKEGLALIGQQKPDAVLLDINLPDMSGWDVLQHITESPQLKHIKVHIMSAYDKEMLGRQIEADEYIPKPVTLEMLDKAFGKIRQGGKTIQKVLVVEDHPAENEAITELLLAHNISSVSAFSGSEAQSVLQNEKIDCVILDLNLPDMGGFELMAMMRQNGNSLPIVVYSGKDLSEEEEFQLKKYANTIIIKNQFSYIRLLDEVQLFLHKVNEKLPGGEADFQMKLHIPEEILKDKKVLVVDDDVRNVYSLFNLLEQHHMKIVVANDGTEALEKIKTEKGIDIVLMDVMMPEMDGIEATKLIRKNPAFSKLPIIALTAKAMKGDKEKCIQAGASDYISKPIDVDKLLALMRVWLYKGV